MSYLKYDGSAAVETGAPASNLYGTEGADTQTGSGAAEGLWGKHGDVLVGAGGDDTYYLQDSGVQVVEAIGGGTDMLVAWRNAGLGDHANIENLKIDGDGIYGAGDAHDNVIYAGSGAEQLYGGGGQDVMVAGSGPDTFIVKAGEGSDAIYGFKAGSDVVRLTAGFDTFAQVQAHMSQVGADTKIEFGNGEGVVLRGVQANSLTAANFQLQIDPSKVGAMTFHDEFSSPLSVWNATYNPTGTWRPDYGYQGANGVGSYTLTGNGEQQIYTSPYFRDHAGDFGESPFTSNGDGTLSITARASDNPELFGYGYTSGMISTKESFAQTYGYFEMRAELPQTAGGWPAFWLVPADGSWPPELDVMETLTNDPHADWTTEHSGVGGVHTSHGISSYVPDTADGFHTYGVLWTQTDLTWYVDGVEVFHQATPADMNKPMYMIANLALGGWGGSIDAAGMPAEMKIDYIHAYGLADGSSTVQGYDAITSGGEAYVGPSAGDATTPVTDPGAATSPPPVSPPAIDPAAGQVLIADGYASVLTGGGGADTLTASQGGETLTGGGGADVFVFESTPWSATHIADFEVGVDKLDVSKLYLDGYTGADPVADGYVVFVSDGSGGTAVIVDPDGRATGHPWGDYVVDLEHVAPSTLTAAQVFGAPVEATPASPPPPTIAGVVVTATVAGDMLLGGAGADTLNASQGADTLTGGAGEDRFVFANEPWAPAHITDFTSGADKIDLKGLFAGTGYAGSDPVADHYLTLIDDGNGGTAVLFDRDGTGSGQQWGDYVIDLEHVAPSSLGSGDWIIS